jgi:hypothetical protein
MSVYGRYIWDITVPTGGWDFDTSLTAAVTIPADTYDIFELCAELKTQLDADPSGHTWTVEVDSVGTVSITSDAGVAWTITWGTTDDDLEAALGLDGTEVEDASHVIYGNEQHDFGYYPGTISYGRTLNRGCGHSNTRLWLDHFPVVRARSGNKSMRTVGPATSSETMNLQYGLIKDAEHDDTDIGLKGFIRACTAVQFKFYPDRANDPTGTPITVATLPHTEGTDYYLCTFDLNGDVRVRQQGGPGFCTFQLTLNREV